MKKEKTLFERYAKSLIELVLEPSGQEHVYDELCRRDPAVKKLGRTKFMEEYIPARLALGCGFWSGCCANHRIEEKELQNVFFQMVMKRFETPNSLQVATRFSESLYASNVNPDEPPGLAINDHLFNRLKIDRIDRSSGKDQIAPAFLYMMEVSDALKNVFENEFDDFIYADDDFRVS